VSNGGAHFEPTIAGLARIVEVMLESNGLTIQKYRVLAYLAVAPASPSELALRLRVRPPTVTRLVDGLVDRGFVERRVDESDRRRATHFLTQSGSTALRHANAAIRRAMDGVGQHLSADDRLRAEEGMVLWGEAMLRYWRGDPPVGSARYVSGAAR
jgi:DNA-binding MarR family transcriptional regulator